MCHGNTFCRSCDDDVAAQERADGMKPRLRFSQIPQYPRPEPAPVATLPRCEWCGNSIRIPEWHTNCEAIYGPPPEPVDCEVCGKQIRIRDWPAFNWADRALADSDYEEARAAKRCRYCKNVRVKPVEQA